MVELLKKRIKNEKGLSLVELLAVIVILGIVAAIAVPAIGNIIENSRSKAVISDAVNVMNAANLYFTENSTAESGTVTIAQLKSGGFLESEGKLTAATVTKKAGGNTITFTAPVKGTSTTYSDITLTRLNSATVSSGTITIPAAPTP